MMRHSISDAKVLPSVISIPGHFRTALLPQKKEAGAAFRMHASRQRLYTREWKNAPKHGSKEITKGNTITEEKIAIETGAPEELDDEALEQAAGGCMLYHRLDIIETFSCKVNGNHACYYLKRCKVCRADLFFREWIFSSDPWREVSREEYYYARAHSEGIKIY